MKIKFSRFGILLLTFTLGLTVVSIYTTLSEQPEKISGDVSKTGSQQPEKISVDVPKVESDTLIIIRIKGVSIF